MVDLVIQSDELLLLADYLNSIIKHLEDYEILLFKILIR